MKKHLFTLLALLALTVSSWAQSQIGPIDGFYYEIDGSGNATLIKLPGSGDWESYELSGDITIPGTVNDGVSDYTVTAIGQKAFVSVGISSVTIEEGVTDIYADAFLGSSLQTATLPSTITSLGNQSFDYTALTAFVITATSPASFGGGNPFSLSNVPTLEHIYVPAASVDAYKTAWSSYASLIEEKPVWVTWNQTDVESVNLVAISEGETSSQTVKDITVTASSPESGDYATFSTSEYGNSISIHDGGTITFAPTSGKLKGISISCGGYEQHAHLAAGSGWSWNSSKYTLEWSGDAAASVVLACDGSSDGIYFGNNTSIEFTLEAEEPAPVDPSVVTNTITWDASDILTVDVPMNGNQTINTITASIVVPEPTGDDYCHFMYDDTYNHYCAFSMIGNAYITFAPEEGKLTKIVINCVDLADEYMAEGSGWTWDGTEGKLTWTGESESVVLAGNGSTSYYFSCGPISSIEFTVVTPAPAPTTTITWDQTDVESISLYGSSIAVSTVLSADEIEGITASITRTNNAGTYLQFGSREIWLQNNCGEVTFTSSVGDITGIVITSDIKYSDPSGLSAGWTYDDVANTYTWEGTPSSSVTLSGVIDFKASTIEFTVDPSTAPLTPSGPNFEWQWRQVNLVDLYCSSKDEVQTSNVIKNVITSLERTGTSDYSYFSNGRIMLADNGDLTFKSIVGDFTAIVITCYEYTAPSNLPTDWTYDDVEHTLTWMGMASDEVTLSGNMEIEVSSIKFFYEPALAPYVGVRFFGIYDQTYEITGAHTAKMPVQNIDHTLNVPASVEYNDVTYYVTEIADNAFKDNTDLPNAYIGANVARIGKNAFKGCYRMDEVTVTSTVLESIDDEAFMNCQLMHIFECYTNLPPELGSNVFEGDNRVNHYNVQGSYAVDRYKVADGWSALADKIYLMFGEPDLGEVFFWHNQMTTNLYAVAAVSPAHEAKIIPYTVNDLYPRTLEGRLSIPEEVRYMNKDYDVAVIGADAYKDATLIDFVLIPQAVKTIEAGAFSGCTGVTNVQFLWDDLTGITWADGNVGAEFATAASGNTIISVPLGKLVAYQEWAPAWASHMVEGELLDIDVTASQDPHHVGRYYRTFYDSQTDYLMPPSVWAHAGHIDGENFILSPVAFDGQILPRNTAVVLESETPTYRLIPMGNTAPLYTGPNDLIGTDDAFPRANLGANADKVYVLGKQASVGGNLQVGMGMYRYTGTTLGAHKAYMILNTSNPSSAPVRFLFKHEDQATDVENVGVQSEKASCEKILRNGQLIIIKDGKEYNAQGQVVK